MNGGSQASAGISGKDGSASVAVDGVVYWTFGDTVLGDNGMIPNSISWSGDTDAGDCISLVPKSDEGRAASLLPSSDSELTVWPTGMEETSPDTVHFFYASVIGNDQDSWEVAGVGLASFDTKTLTARRAFDGHLPWPEGLPQPMRTIAEGGYVYVFLGTAQQQWSTDTILARVPINEMESLSSYEYWQPGTGGQDGYWVAGLWDAGNGSWLPGLNQIRALWSQAGLHNGVEVSYNEFLGRWLAVYSSGFMTSISVRSAEKLTGPWDGTDTNLINCDKFHPAPTNEFLCYTGTQQDAYTKDGGRTIYVSYSNGEDYEVFLHELHLAAPILQSVDQRGRAVYEPGASSDNGDFGQQDVAFYASDIPVAGLLPIHRWGQPATGEIRYGPIAPDSSYRDLGIDFYAPADAVGADATTAQYDPVYRWELDGQSRYSPLNLGGEGFEQKEEAFYAACPDSDADGLTDCAESFLGSDASLADTDGDGIGDGYEESTPGCRLLVYDDDQDGEPTVSELLQGANPCVWGPSTREVTGRLRWRLAVS